jgi:hypothetical protein
MRYTPIDCVTGAPHAQPQDGAVRIEACCDFTGNHKVLFDMRGALDAPAQIPSGSVRAQDFNPPSSGRLLIGHIYREGWHS